MRTALLLLCVACASAHPPAPAPAAAPPARDLRFRCLNDFMHAEIRIGPEGEAECWSLDGELCVPSCYDKAQIGVPWTPPADKKGTVLKCSRFGERSYADPVGWCRLACQTLPGCAHKDVKEYVPPPPPPPVRKPAPPPPREIEGQSPCKADADCSVENGHTCCGCDTIEVLSRLHPVERPPACGCADYSIRGPFDDGPCGHPPPPAGEYRAVCRAGACVGVRR